MELDFYENLKHCILFSRYLTFFNKFEGTFKFNNLLSLVGHKIILLLIIHFVHPFKNKSRRSNKKVQMCCCPRKTLSKQNAKIEGRDFESCLFFGFLEAFDFVLVDLLTVF